MKHLVTPVILALSASAAAASDALPAQIPTDFVSSPKCEVSASDLATWFGDGSATKGGFVSPADSTEFSDSADGNCAFYKWGAQMFLWLTSPAENGSLVFDSPGFYDALYDQSQVQEGNSAFSQFQLVRSDTPGLNLKAIRTIKGNRSTDVTNTEIIDEIGQADGLALITRSGATAYFGVHVNDIYAAFAQGIHDPSQPFGNPLDNTTAFPSQFPTEASEIAKIRDYFNTVTDGQGDLGPSAPMTMELKTAWVPVSEVASPEDYIRLQAQVPVLEPGTRTVDNNGTSVTQNILNVTKNFEEVELALIGMHVVGSAKGHPEMIWASFEHKDNAPMAPFYYNKTGGTQDAPATHTTPASGKWTLFDGTSVPTTVPATAQYNSYITPTGSSSDDYYGFVSPYPANATELELPQVAQINPWGLEPSTVSGTKANASNSNDFLTLNANIVTQLAALGDVRANYIQIGNVWSAGNIPTGPNDQLTGGLYMANSTMETFHQYPDGPENFQAQNCFLCHSVSKHDGKADYLDQTGLGVSHVLPYVTQVLRDVK